MKKLLILLFAVVLAVVNSTAKDVTFAPDFKDGKSWTTPEARFSEQSKFRFDESNSNKKMLLIRRGAIRPAVIFTEELGENQDFSYSFELMRLDDNGSICLGFENAANEGVGRIFVDAVGKLFVANSDNKYENTGMVLTNGKIYKISVKCSRANNKVVVKVDGLDDYVTTVKFPKNLIRLQIAPQPPENNRCLIGDLKVNVYEMQQNPNKDLKFFAPDLTNKNTWSNDFARFLEQHKFYFENNELTQNTKMLINRRGGVRPAIKFNEILKDNEDFSYSFDIIRESETSTTCCSIVNDKNENTGLIYINNAGDLLFFTKYGKYESTGMNLKVGKLYHVVVRCFRETETCDVEVVGLSKVSFKVKFYDNLNRLQFAPQAPEGNRSFLNNIEVHVFPSRVKTRENGLKGVNAFIAGNESQVISKLTDGNITEPILLPENCVIEFNLPSRINATGIQIFGGEPKFRNNPSGGLAPASYKVEGLHNGAWAILTEATYEPNSCDSHLFQTDEVFARYDFPTVVIDRLRITFNKSHDTGNRMSGTVSADKRGLYLREIELFSDKKMDAAFDMRELVTCDWRLPIYRNADKANFHVYVTKHPLAPTKAKLIVRNLDNSIFSETDIAALKPGQNVIPVNIAELTNGRYMTEFTVGEQSIRNLLRVERVPEVSAPAEPMMMKGKKMFFTPDNYSLAEYSDMEVVISDVENKKYAETPSPDKLLLFGNYFYKSIDGRYIFRVTDRSFKGGMFGGDTYRILASDSLNSPFTEIKQAPKALARPQIFEYPANAFPKAPNGTKFELYDPAKHGEMPLKNINYVYNYFPTDYGCFKATRRSIYVTGKTVDGTWVMMRSEPLFIDKSLYGDSDFDTGFNSNDNFGGMWLSPDGKELFWAQGQTMKRYKPFVVEYDNFGTGIRIIGVYSTRDGINWKYRNAITVPDESDSLCAQHYGMVRRHIKNSDLYLVYLYNYDSLRQQIYIELNYSRDGINFHRFPGNKPFVFTDNPNDWYFGHAFIGDQIVHENGKYYELNCYASPLPHFAGESFMNHNSLAEVTAEDYRKRFEKRGLAERWPYFEQVGGYEGLAELTRKGYYAAGAIIYREDGWFSLAAADKMGTFTSRSITGATAVYANAEVADNGVFEIELIDKASGKVINTAKIKGDNVKHKLFDLNADKEYILKGKMQNSKLYTLIFE